jgi:predicted transcriptional regulator
MTTKESVLQTIGELPDDASLEEILDAVLLRLKVERGRQQIQEGRRVPHEEVRERLAKWLS